MTPSFARSSHDDKVYHLSGVGGTERSIVAGLPQDLPTTLISTCPLFSVL
jgi:hypothetical protein